MLMQERGYKIVGVLNLKPLKDVVTQVLLTGRTIYVHNNTDKPVFVSNTHDMTKQWILRENEKEGFFFIENSVFILSNHDKPDIRVLIVEVG